MCEYCKEDKNIKEIDDDAIMIINKKGGLVDLDVYIDDFVYTFEINYCPMCGRKLTK